MLRVAHPQPVERYRAHGAGQFVISGPAARAIPLGYRVDHTEQYSGRRGRVDVRADITIALGLLDKVSHNVIELPAPIQRAPLGGSIAAGAQQKRNVRQPIGQYGHALPDKIFQPVDCALVPVRHALRYGKEPVKSPVKGQAEQLLLAIHVMVYRRLRYAQAKPSTRKPRPYRLKSVNRAGKYCDMELSH